MSNHALRPPPWSGIIVCCWLISSVEILLFSMLLNKAAVGDFGRSLPLHLLLLLLLFITSPAVPIGLARLRNRLRETGGEVQWLYAVGLPTLHLWFTALFFAIYVLAHG